MTLLEMSPLETSKAPPTWADECDVCRRIQETVAKYFAVPLDEMHRPSRGSARAAFARQVAMYLVHITMGLNYSETGRQFRRDRTTVAYACQVVEDQRDHPRIDALLQTLEHAFAVR